ncbi:amidase family protein [Oharaeibacter diazotrophicus]|uniref:Indoleacetamide hydrolase n=1 Tax=Oharaeibacter diazotrophicus TaxID=1920512 RepID=A0A4R6RIJ9_9HYPH|nr:amidase family protein [Oharaeibacter diazotrophicus]TDP86202.1 amidase [Oharaeibacter diazotrophicus]BBE71857.1 amidase [Pleomorphomonas sp. SM30]GLS78621.1 amidase [Oharaeibacter diazotrophicus]
MPFQRLDRGQVAELAEGLGIRLSEDETAVFAERMAEQVGALDDFMEMRLEEHRPPRRHLARDPGRRPTAAEDPLNAFIRRCEVPGAATGPLAGKRVAVKDHTAVAGVPMTLGSHFLDGYTPDFDATIVTRLLDAGATVIGKTNMEDFSFGGPGFSGIGDFGRPLNPHDPAHVTGGSSSGSGAAVASGAADIGIGGDQGGSIRIPAAWCGCVGLKASFGLIPHSGVFGLEPSIDFVGPMTRTVADLATVLAVLAGPDGYDPRQGEVPAALPDYVGATGKPVAGLRIGVLAEGFGWPGGEAAVDEVVRAAIAVLVEAGATAVPVSVPLHRSALAALTPLYLEGARQGLDGNFAGAFGGAFRPASFMAAFGRGKRGHSHELPLNFKLMAMAGTYAHERYDGRLAAKAHAVRPAFAAQYAAAFAGCDLLAMPTVPVRAPRYVTPESAIDAVDRTLFGGRRGADLGLAVANCAPFNFVGLPAASLPCAKVDGLPVGLQLVAPMWREDLLLTAAHAFEAAVGVGAFDPPAAG